METARPSFLSRLDLVGDPGCVFVLLESKPGPTPRSSSSRSPRRPGSIAVGHGVLLIPLPGRVSVSGTRERPKEAASRSRIAHPTSPASFASSSCSFRWWPRLVCVHSLLPRGSLLSRQTKFHRTSRSRSFTSAEAFGGPSRHCRTARNSSVRGTGAPKTLRRFAARSESRPDS